jgi:hypothetical protein
MLSCIQTFRQLVEKDCTVQEVSVPSFHSPAVACCRLLQIAKAVTMHEAVLTFPLLQIVKAVIMHEAVLKAQAKKMNVESLRSKAPNGEAAEIRITKVNPNKIVERVPFKLLYDIFLRNIR